MAKFPQLGKVKTRLAQSIGEEQARICYIELLEHCIAQSYQVKECQLYLSITPDNSIDAQFWQDLQKPYTQKIRFLKQGDGGLGERLLRSIHQIEFHQENRIIVMGSDTYNIQADDIDRTFQLLSKNDLIFGAVPDGGFWSMGLSKKFFQLYGTDLTILNQVRWSSENALKDTAYCLNKLNAVYTQELDDLDDITDYTKYLKLKNS